jgi:hypothetical protein
MGKKKDDTSVMKKPKWKVGDIVDVTFISTKRVCKLTELRKHPSDDSRWIYTAVEENSGRLIPFVGINGSEKWANIFEEKFG